MAEECVTGIMEPGMDEALGALTASRKNCGAREGCMIGAGLGWDLPVAVGTGRGR